MFTSNINRRVYHLASRWFRKKRFELFQDFVSQFPEPVSILDIGGTQDYWIQMGNPVKTDIRITIMNLVPARQELETISICVGDARYLPFSNDSFDLVFSNSVIEHMGNWSEQIAMAEELRRVGSCYFVQTPNRNFPVEPHFMIPFFQFLPSMLQIWLLYRLRVEYFDERITTIERAREVAAEVRLLTEREFRILFPGGKLVVERVFGLKKSFMIYGEC